jgi:AcrR family transcriptional regulator
MSLYVHFHSKHELLDLVFERLLHRLFTTDHHATWQTEFEGACRHMRRLLLEHPHWVALLTRVKAPPSALGVYERLLGLMRKDGFRPEAAMFAFSTIMSHALGSVLVERLMGGNPPVPRQRLELVRDLLTTVPRGTYPRIAAAAPKFDRWTFDRVFEIGLHSLVTGLDTRCARHGSCVGRDPKGVDQGLHTTALRSDAR